MIKSVSRAVLPLVILLQACGENTFLSDREPHFESGKQAALNARRSSPSEANGTLSADSTASPKQGSIEGAAQTETKSHAHLDGADKKAWAACAAIWKSPIPAADAKITVVLLPLSVLGSRRVSDKSVTDKPSLMLIKSGVSVLNSFELELLNPKGWYCIESGVEVLTGWDIAVAETAHLSDGTTSLSVLSQDVNGKETGISVLSQSRITRVPGNKKP